MQKKPILITAGIVLLVVCSFLFIRSKYLVKPQDTEVIAFLDKFNADVVAGNPDSLLPYFNTRQNSKPLLRLLNLLCNKTNASGKGSAMFNVSLTTDYSDLKIVNNELLEVRIPVTFKEKNSDASPGKTYLFMTLRKTDTGKFIILQTDGRGFFKDYLAFENQIRLRDTPVQLLFDKLTLAAFANAEKLKGRYDSVLYFEHVNNKTYFYVAKGRIKTVAEVRDNADVTEDYKIGLLDPDLKEIIPPQYDVIHNIGGTISGLIEVEKDNKRGLYDALGKLIVPVEYDQILPLINMGENVGVLQKGDTFFYLKTDLTLSESVTDFKISEALPHIKTYGSNYTQSDSTAVTLIEHNSRDDNYSVVYPPSYLTDWDILPKEMRFPDPLTKLSNHEPQEFEGDDYYKVFFKGHTADSKNWFESLVYNVFNNYVGGRGGLYQTKTLLFVDKKQNKIYSKSFPTDHDVEEEGGSGGLFICNENYVRQLNDTLFEYRSTENPEQTLLDKTDLTEAPYYHYLHLVNGKLEALPSERLFAFTQYVKMDDSYLQGCFMLDGKQIDHMTRPMLEYIKNEIYASYKYKFKNPGWQTVFEGRFNAADEDKHDNVNDSLTVIDKYNLNFIAQKLKGVKSPPKVLAAK